MLFPKAPRHLRMSHKVHSRPQESSESCETTHLCGRTGSTPHVTRRTHSRAQKSAIIVRLSTDADVLVVNLRTCASAAAEADAMTDHATDDSSKRCNEHGEGLRRHGRGIWQALRGRRRREG